MERKMVNLHRIACQAFLFLREKEKKYPTLELGLMRKNESSLVAGDKESLGATWVNLPPG